MAYREPDRADDERLLAMLARRRAGEGCTSIGRAMGVSKSAVIAATGRVMQADLAHPDPGASEAQIRGAYW